MLFICINHFFPLTIPQIISELLIENIFSEDMRVINS